MALSLAGEVYECNTSSDGPVGFVLGGLGVHLLSAGSNNRPRRTDI